ncbi:hypothetical protein [Actinomadura sp. GTD37]|uniref:hypothetical protein n=1 Tax=Actinomadura sp. GTD37 TaxID=1778030 RepID=UPI0035C065BE
MTDLIEMHRTAARCSFYERTAVPGGYTYEHLVLKTSPGATGLTLPHPPAVGDLVSLPGIVTTFRVVERAWSYNAYGSANWPPVEHEPVAGPMLDVIVERDVGPFRDEVSTGLEDDDD